MTWAMSDQLDRFDGPHGGAGEPAGPGRPADAAEREFAVDPRENVVLEASAGTGKTRVLVERYLNLLKAGVDPANILAITFTRKAAAEMHERIVRRLREEAAHSPDGRRRWLALRDRLGEIAVSTIDAFCLSLLREFPLEAGLDPGFEVADDTELPRLREVALDRALAAAVARARHDEALALVLVRLGPDRVRQGLAVLLERRLVAREALARALARAPHALTVAEASARVVERLGRALGALTGGLDEFVADGPVRHPRFALVADALRQLAAGVGAPAALGEPAALRAALDRVREYFLTQDGDPRRGGPPPPFGPEHARSREAWRRHGRAVRELAPAVQNAFAAFDGDLHAIAARGVGTLYELAEREYRRVLDERAVVDFSDLVDRALHLLRQMDEFAQSRYRLESRYHHVLVDEFQDTSRAQWELIALLVQSWGEGFGLVHDAPLAPSIFIVGDRKQSIYGFRDADVAVMEDAARFIERLRPDGPGRVRRAIRQSLRAVPELLAFVNDVFREVAAASRARAGRPDAFRYTPDDAFPVDEAGTRSPADASGALGLVVGDDVQAVAEAVADEIARVCGTVPVRDRHTGTRRPAQPGDIAILFRSRAYHRCFEAALEARGLPAYVYQGLGFFDADEIKDLTALVRFLAEPTSNLRAAALLRSRIARLSDAGLAQLAPDLAAALVAPTPPPGAAGLSDEDAAVLAQLRSSLASWLARADLVPPAELIDEILEETAYFYELRGPRAAQAWANVKKFRALVRRIQNRGYLTLDRLARSLDALRAGEESPAVIEALEAVNLLTVHAAKGLEFPVVFVVNLTKGVGAAPPAVRVVRDPDGAPRVVLGAPSVDVEESARDEEREHDSEETKRLLYVALTRARDRLYLAAVLKNGQFKPGRGSLGSVMPPGVQALFESARLEPAESLPWRGASGRTYHLRVCRAGSRPTAASERTPGAPAVRAPDDFAPVVPSVAATPDTATALAALEAGGEEGVPGAIDGDRDRSKLVGRLVHRLFRVQVPAASPSALAAAALALVEQTERPSAADLDAAARDAAEIYAGLQARDDVRALFGDSLVHFEVPFSLYRDGRLVRGVIDAIVEQPDGRVVVVEIKTGNAHPSHQAQLAVYVEAARVWYPDRRVEGLVLYG
jgi:ATP-dependent helicase/nuclease subunit A